MWQCHVSLRARSSVSTACVIAESVIVLGSISNLEYPADHPRLGNIRLVLHSFALYRLSGMDGTPQLRATIDHVQHQMEPIEVVQDRNVKRRGGCTFLLIPAHMQILIVRPSVGQAMNHLAYMTGIRSPYNLIPADHAKYADGGSGPQ